MAGIREAIVTVLDIMVVTREPITALGITVVTITIGRTATITGRIIRTARVSSSDLTRVIIARAFIMVIRGPMLLQGRIFMAVTAHPMDAGDARDRIVSTGLWETARRAHRAVSMLHRLTSLHVFGQCAVAVKASEWPRP